MPTRDHYSPLKVFHHQDRIKSLRRGEHVAPIHVQLVPTNRCNQACEGCAYRIKGYSSNQLFRTSDEIPWDKLVEVVSDCSDMGVRAIQLTGGGEPTVHPQFLALCDMILGEEIDLALVTNGACWTPAHIKLLCHAKWVRFSLDAGCAGTYANYRHTAPELYKKVRGAICSLAATKYNGNPLVGVGFVVNNQNWREVVEATRRAREDGADNIRISALFQPQGAGYFQEFFSEVTDACREAVSLASETFAVFNMFGDRLQDLEEASPNYSFCGCSYLVTYLGANCQAYTCCMNAYNTRGFLGAFEDQSFRDMWNSEETHKRLLTLDARECPPCMYNGKNRVIAYAVKTNPDHVNFI